MPRVISSFFLFSFLHPPRDERADETTPRTLLEFERPPATRHQSGGHAGLSVHVEQRGASRAERDGYLVHRTIVAGGDIGDRRGVLADSGMHAAVWRRRFDGPDTCGAGVWRSPVYARLAGDLDRPLGIAPHGALVCLAEPHRRVDFRALRHSPGHPTPRSRILV